MSLLNVLQLTSSFITHVVISGSKTNSNFRRKTNLAGTSTVRVCNSASPRRTGWQIHNLQSRTAWKKKVAKASRVLAFEGMFIEQHTFLVIKSQTEIKQLFIFLCISYITLKLLLAEGLLIWMQRLFCFVKWPDEWTDQSKITTKQYQICKQAALLCRYEGAIERCPSSYSLCWQEAQRSFDWRKLETKMPQIREQAFLICHKQRSIQRCPSYSPPCWEVGQRNLFLFGQTQDWTEWRKTDTKTPQIRV